MDVPVTTAYNQWTQFEEFPRFMEGVEEVKQLDDTHLHWRAEVGGKPKEWDAEITEQIPDRRIAWRSTERRAERGRGDLRPLGDDRTRVTCRWTTSPRGVVEKIGDALGAVKLARKGNLKRFKEFVEGAARRPAPGAARSRRTEPGHRPLLPIRRAITGDKDWPGRGRSDSARRRGRGHRRRQSGDRCASGGDSRAWYT